MTKTLLFLWQMSHFYQPNFIVKIKCTTSQCKDNNIKIWINNSITGHTINHQNRSQHQYLMLTFVLNKDNASKLQTWLQGKTNYLKSTQRGCKWLFVIYQYFFVVRHTRCWSKPFQWNCIDGKYWFLESSHL